MSGSVSQNSRVILAVDDSTPISGELDYVGRWCGSR